MLRIGEVAELAGVSTRTIRHYHQIGLLPEPARMANGYRGYELRDVVVLLRVRRLAELGLRLDEVAGVLADDKGRELRDILVELDADLSEQERRIRFRRQRIAELLTREDATALSGELTDLLTNLDQAAGEPPDADREQLVARMFDVMSGELTSSLRGVYRAVFTDRDVAARMVELSTGFRDLLGRSPDDPAVAEVARRAADLAPAVLSMAPKETLAPKEIRRRPGEPGLAGQSTEVGSLSTVAIADPAQLRCCRLLLDYLREVDHVKVAATARRPLSTADGNSGRAGDGSASLAQGAGVAAQGVGVAAQGVRRAESGSRAEGAGVREPEPNPGPNPAAAGS
jgi:DNA-binding transcriptional MerR regulator